MEAGADPLAVELALDRVEAELVAELPAHLRAFARAHAAGAPVPPAPAAVRRAASVVLARRAAAAELPELTERGLALLRLVAPSAIEDDPAVARARAAEPAWPALAELAAARDAASRARFGRRFVELMRALGGAGGAGGAGDPPVVVGPLGALDPIDGWDAPGHAIDRAEIEVVWRELAQRHGAQGRVEVIASDAGRPRAFVVEPGREVIVVVPAGVATPAARFAVLHELGHALGGLLAPAALPRAVDEAVASYAARALEAPSHPWYSPLAGAARARRTVIARLLDEIERALPALEAPPPPSPRAPWALWHDPGSQASYVAAEQIAEGWSSGGAEAGLAGAISRAAAVAARATIAAIREPVR
jgi:hypothetical protein